MSRGAFGSRKKKRSSGAEVDACKVGPRPTRQPDVEWPLREEKLDVSNAEEPSNDGRTWARLGPLTRRRLVVRAMQLGMGALAAPALAEALAACTPATAGKKLTWSRRDDLRTQEPQKISGLKYGISTRR